MKQPPGALRRALGTLLTVAITAAATVAATPAHAAGELVVSQAQLGNIFYDTQTVQIPVATTGNKVEWSIVDGFGVAAGSGQAAVTGGSVTIEPQLGRVGYFEMHIRALQDSTVLAEADTSFAVIKQTSATTASSKFGVMTHFAQGWNTDLMPLIAKAGLPSIRDEAYWKTVETTAGSYNFSSFDPYFATAAANGLEVMPPLTFGNQLYDWAERSQIWTVRRWVSDAPGDVRLTGRYRRSSANGDGTGIKILVDGNPVLDKLLTTTTAETYDLTVAASAGSMIDFIVTPGPGTKVDYDAVTFSAQIYSGTTLVADATAEFSGAQGANGWHYGYYVVDIHAGESLPVTGFVPMAAFASNAWTSPFQWQKLEAIGAHPAIAAKAKQYWATRRWISEVSGDIRITGTYQRVSSSGDGTGIKILVNGSVVWERQVQNTTSTAYDLTVPVTNGAPVELVITSGTAKDVSYDEIKFKAQIYSGTTLLADSVAEFSGTQGANNWNYGYYTVSVPKALAPVSTSDFTEMPTFGNNAWTSTQQWLKLDTNGGHPAGASVDGQGSADFTAPVTDDGRLGYANYGKALLDHYPQVNQVEIWNEYNGSFCIGQCKNDRAGYYTEMLKKAYEVVKAAHPDVTVLGGATVMAAAGFNEDMFAAGALNYMDVFSYHPYNQWGTMWNDHNAYYDLQDLDAQIRKWNNGVSKPIWATEYGSNQGSTLEGRTKSAKYTTRLGAVLASNNLVERAYFYLMKDSGSGPNMGLVRGETDPFGKYTPTPNYAAYANLIHQLNGATPLPRDYVARSTEVFSLPFTLPGTTDTTRIIWSVGRETDVLVWTGSPVTVTDLFGTSKVVNPSGGKVRIRATDSPVYVKGAVTSVSGTSTPAIADSFQQFSNVQGKNNWYYGFFDVSASPNPGPNDFQQGYYTDFFWNWQWQLGTDETVKVTRPGGYPSRVNPSIWSVRRWKSTVGREVYIRGVTGTGGANNNHTFAILIDGTEVFSRTVTPSDPKEMPYELRISIPLGAKVDFVIKHGPGGLNSAADKQVFTARISDR